MNICWWEYEELLEHFERRSDIWEQNAENDMLWLRLREGEALCALHFVPPADAESLFRQYDVTAYPVALPQEDATRYMVDLLKHWTSYGHRCQTEFFMREELKLPADVARLSAIALESYEWQDSPVGDPEDDLPATQPPLADGLLPDKQPPQFEVDDPLVVGTYLLRDGGYVQLRMSGGMLRVECSLPSVDTDGFSHPLTGFVRPRDGSIRDTVAALSGRGRWIVTPMEPDREAELLQQQRLREVEA